MHLQIPKKTRKRMLQVPSILLVAINLVATSSQEEFPPEEGGVVQEQAYPIIEATHEEGILQNDGHEDEHIHDMDTFQSNSYYQ